MAEGPCEVKSCGHVFQTAHMPELGEARCPLCRVIEDSRSLSANAQKLAYEREKLQRELVTAYRRISELEDDLAEAKGAA
jgi:alkylated DNA nucleotide flippase Atl1